MLWDDDSNETGVATDRAFLGQFEARALPPGKFAGADIDAELHRRGDVSIETYSL